MAVNAPDLVFLNEASEMVSKLAIFDAHAVGQRLLGWETRQSFRVATSGQLQERGMAHRSLAF
jgi:hypothetical protein